MKKKRLTVYLPESLLFKAKLLALERGVSVSKLLEDLLSRYIESSQPKTK